MSLRTPLITLTIFSLLTTYMPNSPEWLPSEIEMEPPNPSETIMALTTDTHHVYTLSNIDNVTYWNNNDTKQLNYAHNKPINNNEHTSAYGNVYINLKINSITTNNKHTYALLTSKNIHY